MNEAFKRIEELHERKNKINHDIECQQILYKVYISTMAFRQQLCLESDYNNVNN